jgi:hypothetical protein
LFSFAAPLFYFATPFSHSVALRHYGAASLVRSADLLHRFATPLALWVSLRLARDAPLIFPAPTNQQQPSAITATSRAAEFFGRGRIPNTTRNKISGPVPTHQKKFVPGRQFHVFISSR